MSGTPSDSTESVPGWYINFQAAVITQLPRPGEIDQATAESWDHNRSRLSDVLAEALLPSLVDDAGIEVEEVQPQMIQRPDLTNTGPTFGSWLMARQMLHKHFTGETANLCGMFDIPRNLLDRTDIMPVFRPAGATNRMAMDWRVKLGQAAPYEEADVMEYKGSSGPEVPELYYINRSVTPDADTLGENAKSPDGHIESKRLWLGLYGWSDADLLHSLITGINLDSGNTWTWFPNDRDRQPGGRKVARVYWNTSQGQARFGWCFHNNCNSHIGARVAVPIPLKT